MTHPIIVLWSHPRSMSTAFERIMRARGDLECLHEPFMYDYYINRGKRQMPHFDAQEGHPRTYEKIQDMIVARAERGPVFIKDMAYYVLPHILSDKKFLDRLMHSFLLRDPKASLTSYAKLDPDFTSEELGFEAQWRLYAHLDGQGVKPAVVLSEQVQMDPVGEMRRYWQAVGLPDKPEALQWSNEIPEDWKQVADWHGSVLSSTSIRQITDKKRAEIERGFEQVVAASPRLKTVYDHHLPFYEKLRHVALPVE